MTPGDPLQPHGSTPAELHALYEQRRDGAPFLAWRDDQGALQLQRLVPATPKVTIGRANASAISLPWDREASKVHATLEPVDEEWMIVDNGSTNGTYVDGAHVDGRTRLRHESRVTIGRTILVFHAGGLREEEEDDDTWVAGKVVQRHDLTDNELLVLQELCRPIVVKTSTFPTPTKEIAEAVYLSVDGVKRCLTRLYLKFDIADEPKREQLVKIATEQGIIKRRHFP